MSRRDRPVLGALLIAWKLILFSGNVYARKGALLIAWKRSLVGADLGSAGLGPSLF